MDNMEFCILISLMDSHPLPKLLVFKHLQPDITVIYHTDTEAVQEYQADFSRWVKQHDVPVHSQIIDETDLSGMIQVFNDFILKSPSKNVVFDITGAAPLMVIAAEKTAQIFGARILFLDDDTNKIVFTSDQQAVELDVKLTVKDCFEVSGSRIIGIPAHTADIDPDRKDIAFFIGKHYREIRPLLRFINGKYRMRNNYHNLHFRMNSEFARIITRFVKFLDETRYLRLTRCNDGEIQFKLCSDQEKKRFLCGGWLEDYVMEMAHNCDPDDLKQGVVIQWDGDDKRSSRYEIDVAFVKNDRLIIVECKSGGYILRKESEITHHLMRLAAIRRYFGGLYAEAILVISGQIPKQFKSEQRAKEFDIPIFDYDELEKLDMYFDRFRPGGRTF